MFQLIYDQTFFAAIIEVFVVMIELDRIRSSIETLDASIDASIATAKVSDSCSNVSQQKLFNSRNESIFFRVGKTSIWWKGGVPSLFLLKIIWPEGNFFGMILRFFKMCVAHTGYLAASRATIVCCPKI